MPMRSRFHTMAVLVGGIALGCNGTNTLPAGICNTNHDCAHGQMCVGGRCELLSVSGDGGGVVHTDGSGQPDPHLDSGPGPSPSRDASADGRDSGGGGNPDAMNMSTSCNQDNDCSPGAPEQICDHNACVLGCGQNPASCGQGTVCNTRTGHCQSVAGACGSDSDCGPPAHVCEQRQCVPGCGMLGGIQCSGSTCDTSTGRCTGGPPPDAGFAPDAVSPTDTGFAPDAVAMPDSGSGMDASAPDAMPQMGQIANLVANPSAYANMPVTVQNVVVTAVSAPASGTSATLYLQDMGASGPGLSVYIGPRDTAPVPQIGDVVTVTGRLSPYDGVLQLATSTRDAITLSITINSSGGTAQSGAYPPAGTPTPAGNMSDFSYSLSNPHPELVGNVIVFPGPLSVTNRSAFSYTDRDGGVHTEGFEVNGMLWVDQSLIFKDCIAPLDGGVLRLSTGIRGVWDRFQDYYGGSATVPVLYPMSCADLSP